MVIQFMNTSDDPRKVGKTWNVIKEINSAHVYHECTVENPDIIIDYDINVLNANYMYIPDFKRYYFISTMDLLEGERMVLHGHVDVLQTYLSDILNISTVIARQESSGLSLVPDTNIAQQNYNPIDIYNSGFAFDVAFGSYVLQLLGGN